MTHRLYYEDAYLKEFEATVLECEPCDAQARNSFNPKERIGPGKYCVRLDRSAFYPTSGGQPYDTGILGERRVLDVFVGDSGEVWHVLDGALEAGEKVVGTIDWPRRFDHMQQHAGEHMLAGQFFHSLHGHTIGLHLGAEFSSIDVELPGGEMRVDAETLGEIERRVNENIQRDVPIICSFPDPQTLAQLRLRKPPTVQEHVRVVSIGDFEAVACGGTHPSSTGQIGLLKILDARPSRGKMRVCFVCGMRAYRDYQRRFEVIKEVAEGFSTGFEELPRCVEGLKERLYQAKHEMVALKRSALLDGVDQMLQTAQPGVVGKVVCAFVEADGALLRDLATNLVERPGIVALLGAKAGENCQYVFARSADVEADMGALIKSAAAQCGGKGGGKKDFAQGGGPEEMLKIAKLSLIS